MVPSLHSKDDPNQNIPSTNRPPNTTKTGLVSHMMQTKQSKLMNTERVDRMEPIQRAKDPTKHNSSFPIRSFV